MGDGSARDEVSSGLRIGPHGLECDIARQLDLRSSGNPGNPLPRFLRTQVVEKYMSRPGGESLVQFRKRATLDLNRQVRWGASCKRRRYSARRRDVIVLDKHGIPQT